MRPPTMLTLTPTPRRSGETTRDAWLTLGLLAVFLANGRAIGGGDTMPAALLQVALVRGDGLTLDRLAWAIRTETDAVPGYCSESRGHVVSRYPIGPALTTIPFAWISIVWLDHTRPGWDAPTRDPSAFLETVRHLGKLNAALVAALAVGLLPGLLRRLELHEGISIAVVALGLGSGVWPTASQALWQHGPAIFWLMVALRALIPPGGIGESPQHGLTTTRLAVAGGATALMVMCRPIDLLFAAVIAGWVVISSPARAGLRRWGGVWRPFGLTRSRPFWATAGLLGLAWCGYNLWFFDSLNGGYAEIEKMHPWAHGLKGTWTGSLLWGGLGTLVSPSHGLLIHCPWVVPALALLPRVWNRLPSWNATPIRALLAVGLPLNFLALAKYSCWWGGHCFGARFWIDATPLFVIALAAVRTAAMPSNNPCLQSYPLIDRRWRWLLIVTLAAAVWVHGVAFWRYPTSWHANPTNVDRDHARLWDWFDTETTRALTEPW
ncbi:hypothetical protein Isop_2196 [Isosphaera pallida ATCC 43644]|uniref:Glycosyltransferase RgtA/B/C/D-like domain-containing protein n=1 Tax=Isosphaera pallida (strain ATCC 43644 / DSM 9630 / IS1B) TaxID=575540 RepID=E8R517_ISOPI|nr:hypothetical protein [Isosphaera pallida]ADV62774.1 hypothetical protein Isop_2196 [Isosphaera pallida ATCC 43644]